ncbi:MAG: hypothetical protein DWQ05_14320 [Calditrichaeota bacterium]|nr:MAG: hypothetical protein DWQ05_14320 [Calditrichota bacterium]
MRKVIIIFALACFASLLISSTLKNTPYEEELIKIQLKEKLGENAIGLTEKPIEIQALMLDYSENEILFLKARIALLKYPDLAEKVFSLYGAEPDFQHVLSEYGEIVVPVVDFFYENESALQEVIRRAQNEVLNFAASLKKMIYEPGKKNPEVVNEPLENLTPLDRGWNAVHFIKNEGYDFLGQFALDKNNNVRWIQTERFLENINAFFVGGIRTLEVKYVLDEKISGYDLLWGAVDIAVIGGTLKLLRAGRVAAKSGKKVSFAARTRLFAPRLFATGGFIVRRIVVVSAAAATIYIVAENPHVLHGMMAEIAGIAGINPYLFQTVGWILVLFILSYPVLWILRFLIHPAIWILNGIVWLFKKVDFFLNPPVAVENIR